MSYEVQKIKDEPIILAVLHEDYDLVQELHPANAAAAQILEKSDEPMTLIIDLRCKLDLEDMMIGAAGTSIGSDSLYHHPKLLRIVYVSTDPVIKYGLQGLDSEVYNYLKIPCFDTVDNALNYVRELAG